MNSFRGMKEKTMNWLNIFLGVPQSNYNRANDVAVCVATNSYNGFGDRHQNCSLCSRSDESLIF